MKRILSIVMILALTIAVPAMAETLSWEGGTVIDSQRASLDLDGDGVAEEVSQRASLDLDGDGVAEEVSQEMVPDDFDQHQQLRVVAADGSEAVFDFEALSENPAWACDLDGDGVQEIFMWGDVMSDDYYTVCLHYANGRLTPVLFADSSRGDNVDGYFKSGYGMLDDVDLQAGTVTLCGSQDILGTYFMDRTFRLSEDGLFEFADDGMWRRDVSDLSDDAWEWGGLTAKAEIPCALDGQDATLQPGDKIVISGSDKRSVATFVTRDGREGTLSIGENYQQGWGVTVNDVPEEELFEFLPYAD